MKNQYFGDINDYRKYGLLRTLARAGLSVGVCWLLTADDGGGQGSLRSYLAKPGRWRHHDRELYDLLQRLQQDDVERNVRQAVVWGIVPGATYFDRMLTDGLDQRDVYFEAALDALARCDVIFFDPDIGIEVSSTERGRQGSARYIYWTELRRAYAAGHSLLVYQHFPHVERSRFVPFLASRLGEELSANGVGAFVTSHVVFFLVPQATQYEALARAVDSVRRAWQGQIHVWQPTQVAA